MLVSCGKQLSGPDDSRGMPGRIFQNGRAEFPLANRVMIVICENVIPGDSVTKRHEETGENGANQETSFHQISPASRKE